jgi:hypothetical protein
MLLRNLAREPTRPTKRSGTCRAPESGAGIQPSATFSFDVRSWPGTVIESLTISAASVVAFGSREKVRQSY